MEREKRVVDSIGDVRDLRIIVNFATTFTNIIHTVISIFLLSALLHVDSSHHRLFTAL